MVGTPKELYRAALTSWYRQLVRPEIGGICAVPKLVVIGLMDREVRSMTGLLGFQRLKSMAPVMLSFP